jgi:hypothetical protein
MAHDKIGAAARDRMMQAGETHAAARAVIAGHQAGGQVPSPGAGHALRMSGEIRDWLAGLRGSDPAAAMAVVPALAALLNEGARLGEPLVVSTEDSWPWALFEALDRSYQEGIERATALRRGQAAAETLVSDIQGQASELEAAQAKLEDRHRRLLDAGSLHEAAQAAEALAAARQQAATARRLLPRMIEAGRRLGAESRRFQAGLDAFRSRKEVLKASYTAAHASLVIHKALATVGLAGNGDLQQEDPDEATGTADARLVRDATTQMERESGQQAWPQGLMELRPVAADGDTSIRILFAVEPPGTILLIAVLDGSEIVEDQRREAILLSADMLRRVRAGQAPEAAAHGYDDTRQFLEEF